MGVVGGGGMEPPTLAGASVIGRAALLIVCLCLAACGGGGGAAVNRGPAAVRIHISPASASLVPGEQKQFQAMLSNASNAGVSWSVDGVDGGNAVLGTVSKEGIYSA